MQCSKAKLSKPASIKGLHNSRVSAKASLLSLYNAWKYWAYLYCYNTTLWNSLNLFQQFTTVRRCQKCHWLDMFNAVMKYATSYVKAQFYVCPCARAQAFVPALLLKCSNQPVFFSPGCWAVTCQEQWIWVSHDEAAPPFDVHDEPVHRPAERRKPHRRCFGWLAVTPSVNEIFSNFPYIPSHKMFLHPECEHLETQVCCKLLEKVWEFHKVV